MYPDHQDYKIHLSKITVINSSSPTFVILCVYQTGISTKAGSVPFNLNSILHLVLNLS